MQCFIIVTFCFIAIFKHEREMNAPFRLRSSGMRFTQRTLMTFIFPGVIWRAQRTGALRPFSMRVLAMFVLR